MRKAAYHWDRKAVKGLRLHLDMSQTELAAELGVRQPTISEGETGAYRPRGASERVLNMFAVLAGYAYQAHPPQAPTLRDA